MIETIAGAASLARRLRSRKQSIGFTNGCFDLFHVGHLRSIRFAKNHCDFLFVGVNSDQGVRELKGAGRPIIPVIDRAEIVSHLRSVGAVVVFDTGDLAHLVAAIRPDVIVKGDEYRGKEIIGSEHARSVVFCQTSRHSTTAILSKIRGLICSTS